MCVTEQGEATSLPQLPLPFSLLPSILLPPLLISSFISMFLCFPLAESRTDQSTWNAATSRAWSSTTSPTSTRANTSAAPPATSMARSGWPYPIPSPCKLWVSAPAYTHIHSPSHTHMLLCGSRKSRNATKYYEQAQLSPATEKNAVQTMYGRVPEN